MAQPKQKQVIEDHDKVVFDFTLDDRDDEFEVADGATIVGGGISNPVDVELEDVVLDGEVETVKQVHNKGKRKLPPKGPNPKKLKEGATGNRIVSAVWDHFEKVMEDGLQWAVCKYCGKRYMADSKKHGFSNLKSHTPVCRLYPNRDKEGQSNISFKRKGECVEVVSSVFSQDDCKRALAEMIIIDELPFRFVEGVGFRRFCEVMQPKFLVVSRQTITREVSVINNIEKGKLKKLLKGRRICLTTDTWTSIQNINYMCLTAHFVDDNWKLQKRILNFCQVEDHKGITIGKKIESLLLEWKVDGIFTITVDNASSNKTALSYLQRKTMEWKRTVLDNLYMHLRCNAHILNLIVVDGLKEQNESIGRVRDVVRYVRSSPQRLESFKKCANTVQIVSGQNVCLDVCTRWNSTYLMLEVAVKFEKAFERMREDDISFQKYFGISEDDEDGEDSQVPVGGQIIVLESGQGGAGARKPRLPTKLDWKNCRMFVKFLKLFYDATKQFSGSLFVTSNAFFDVMVRIESSINSLVANEDPLLSTMASKMKEKFDKYWGDEADINPLLFVAAALDPRFKLKYLKFWYNKTKGEEMGVAMEQRVKSVLHSLYDAYAKQGEAIARNPVSSAPIAATVEVDGDGAHLGKLHMEFSTFLEEEHSLNCSSEVDRYLGDMCVRIDDTFQILDWWKNNSNKYPIMSQVARDILAMPLSTVASESAFSTGGRVLDPFRSSLLPSMVEALVCTQNWLLSTVPISLRQAMDKVEDLEREFLEPEIESTNANYASTSGNLEGAKH